MADRVAWSIRNVENVIQLPYQFSACDDCRGEVGAGGLAEWATWPWVWTMGVTMVAWPIDVTVRMVTVMRSVTFISWKKIESSYIGVQELISHKFFHPCVNSLAISFRCLKMFTSKYCKSRQASVLVWHVKCGVDFITMNRIVSKRPYHQI